VPTQTQLNVRLVVLSVMRRRMPKHLQCGCKQSVDRGTLKTRESGQWASVVKRRSERITITFCAFQHWITAKRSSPSMSHDAPLLKNWHTLSTFKVFFWALKISNKANGGSSLLMGEWRQLFYAVRVPAEARQSYSLCPLNGTLPTAALT